MKHDTVDVIIPTYKPDEKFDQLLQMLTKQSYPIRHILVMNTEEAYFPKQEYENWPNLTIEHLTVSQFDHGGTRNRAASSVDGDFLCFMTQDAVPADKYLIEQLVLAFQNSQVEAVYARQLPASDCREIERYTRSFNYPDKSSIKSLKDLPRYGIKTFFCSNVCAMYRRETYVSLGGFDTHTIFNEDMIFAGKIVQNGGSIAYQAEAKVIHSHNYSNIEQLRRNFDLAVSQADHPEIFGMAKSESEGIRLVKKTAGHLLHIKTPWLIVSLVVTSGFKLIGYKLGKRYQKLPKTLILKLTMNKTYWNKNRRV